MSEFDGKAREWDKNPVHWERSEAVARHIMKMVPLNKNMKVMEFGAGTGILSFILQNHFSEITLMDNSTEMVKVMHKKIAKSGFKQMKPLLFDSEHNDYQVHKFDLIYSQMVLHHINDVEAILNKFYFMLNPCGYLAVADLITEDGCFHGKGFNGHLGFDVNNMAETLKKKGFKNIVHVNCFVEKKQIENGTKKDFPVFLLTASK